MRVKGLTILAAVITGLPVAGLLLPMTVLGASPPRPSTTCGNSNSGQIKYTTNVDADGRGYKRAHNDVLFITAPGQTSGSRTLSATSTFSASVAVSPSITVSASAVVASVEGTVGMDLNLGVAFSTGDSWTVGPYKNTTSSYRDAVAFVGTRTVAGQYTKWKCGLSASTGFYAWLTQTTNTYRLWNQIVVGMAWCNDDAAIRAQYGQWSLQYSAVSAC